MTHTTIVLDLDDEGGCAQLAESFWTSGATCPQRSPLLATRLQIYKDPILYRQAREAANAQRCTTPERDRPLVTAGAGQAA